MLKLLLILFLATSIPLTSVAFGQQFSVGEKPKEDIVVTIDENGTAHVVHKVNGPMINPVQVDMITGNMTNFSVIDQSGGSVQYSSISGPQKAVLLLPSNRNMTLIKYDLPNIVSFNNGIWTWKYYDPADATFTDFYFPKGVDMIWSNVRDDPSTARPVYLGDHGLRQVGNGFTVQYTINEPVTIQAVQWQDKTFDVGVRTLANVGLPIFDQSAMSYTFNVDQQNAYVTVIMPKELLWGPYQATINTNKTLTSGFHDNETHSWIGIRPTQSGTVQIIGTSVVPEFPIFVPLAIAISAVVGFRFFNKLNFK